MRLSGLFFTFVLLACAVNSPRAADLTVREVTQTLVRASAAAPASFAGRDLSGLDLSGLDFRGTDLEGANLTAADLTDADFSRARLARARLDRAVIIRANFAGADLSHASLVRPVTFSTIETRADEVANFFGTNLSGARVFARLGRADMRRAILIGAMLGDGSHPPRTPWLWRTDLSGCNLELADLTGAKLDGVLLAFANLAGAALGDAEFHRADLSHANLSGADVAGANFAESNLDGTVLRGASGIERSRGFPEARNRDRAID